MNSNIPQHTPVKTRHVLYFSGFDPRGPAHYRRMYREEAIKQSAVNGHSIEIDNDRSERSSTLSTTWKIRTQVANETVKTTYEFMRWDDVIRNHWHRNEIMLLLHYLRSFWFTIRTGVLGKIRKESTWMFIVEVYPVVLACIVIGLGFGAAYSIDRFAQAAGIPRWIGIGGGLVGFGLCIQAGRMIERLSNSFWLARTIAFTTQQVRGTAPDLEARLDAFSERIANVINESDADEVLLVGHSAGAIIVVAALGRALQRQLVLTPQRRRVSLMTLGHCIPLVSLFPQAQIFRDELAVLANSAQIDWIDFTVPTDLVCFPFLDPLALAGIKPIAGGCRPKLLSARFVTLFSKERYAQIRRNWHRNHFQYLMAGEKAGEYDYFAITAGHLSLAERYRDKPSLDKSVFRKAKP